MSASHNPGGPKEDWGIKFNYSSGEPAPERITDAIYGYTTKISELRMADIPETDLSKIGTHSYGDFEVCSPLSAKTQACTSSVPEDGVGGCCLCLCTWVILQWQMLVGM